MEKKNVGSVEFQINNLNKEIKEMSLYIQRNKKDYVTKRALYRKVSYKKTLLAYLEGKDYQLFLKLSKE